MARIWNDWHWIATINFRGSGEENVLLRCMPGSVGRDGHVGELGDEPSNGTTPWGSLVVAALVYVAVGAWDWTDTVEALAR